MKKNLEVFHGVEFNWKSAGYHPLWFRWHQVPAALFLLADAFILVLLGFFASSEISDLLERLFFAFLFAILAWELLVIFLNRIIARWIPIAAPDVTTQDIHIHIGGTVTLTGILVLPAHSNPPYPVAIVLHGHNSGRGQLNYLSLALAQVGVAILSYDLRGHGQTGGDRNDIFFLIRDLNKVLDYIQVRSELDAARIVVMGVSLGAIIALYEGYLDPRVRHVIGLATTSEYKTMIADNIKPLSKKWWWKLSQRLGGLEVDPSALQSRLVSPALVASSRKSFFDTPVPWDIDNTERVLLLQCQDDYIVKPDNFTRMVQAFDLPQSNVLLLRKGGHGFFQQEMAVTGRIIGWLNSKSFFKKLEFKE